MPTKTKRGKEAPLPIVTEHDGPWVYEQDTGNSITISNHSGDDVTSIVADNELSDDDFKRAGLIAAAPELLAALSFCRSVLQKNGVIETSERLAIKHADAAILKAGRGSLRLILNHSGGI